MKLRRKLRQVAMHRDQVIVHVARMACGVAQPRDARDFGNAMQELAERPGAAETFAMIGVDVLTDQGDFAHASVREILYFAEDRLDRPRDFHTARVRHDAEGAEL